MLLACPQFVQYSWPPTWPKTGWPVGQTLCTIRSSNLFRPTLFRTIVTSSCGSLTGFPHRGQMLLLIGHLLSPYDESSLSQFFRTRTQPLPYLMLNPSDFRSIIFCEPNLGRV